MQYQDRTILHCDLNGFYASVEALFRPDLKGKPMAVGGDPKKRTGIILAKNEEAKKFGVATGEAIWQAKLKCPNLEVLQPHHELYKEYSRKVNAIYARFTNKVESFGIDESWLDVSGSLKLFGSGVEIADKIRETVKSELGLTVSVGVSFNKVFAKLGSDYKKPDATTLFDRTKLESVIYKLPVKDLLFVGRKTAEILTRMRIITIGDLANANERTIYARFGKHGAELLAYARGEDDSPVAYYGETEEVKSVGNSITFPRNLKGRDDFYKGFSKVALKVSTRMFAKKLKCREIGVTIKGADFHSLVRQTALDFPTNVYKDLVEYAMKLTQSHWDFNTPVRMLGITCAKLESADTPYQTDLFENRDIDKQKDSMENAVFNVRKKYGVDSITFGNMLDSDI